MTKRTLVLLLLLVVFVILSFYEYGSFKLVDDTYIYLQYARNIILHHQVAFNIGEKSYGFTSPLWLMLIVIGELLSNLSTTVPEILSIIFSCLTIIIWWQILKKYNLRAISVTILLLVIILDPNLLKHSHIGMETTLGYFLSSLLILLFFYTEVGENLGTIGIVIGLFVLTRPESILLSVILCLWLYSRKKISIQNIVKVFIYATFVILPWILFSLLYFHQIFPSTFGAKGASYPLGLRFAQHSVTELEILIGNYFIPIVLISFLTLKYKDIREITKWTFLIFIIYFLFYSVFLSNELVYARYFCIIFPVLNFNFVVALQKINFEKILNVVLSFFLMSIFLMQSLVYSSLNNKFFKQGETLEDRIVRWVNSNTSPNSVIVRGRIGKIGYLTGRKILDPVGLINPEITKYYLKGDVANFYKKEKPDYFIGDNFDRMISGLKNGAKVSLLEEFQSTSNLLRNYLGNKFIKNGLGPKTTYQKIYHVEWYTKKSDY